MCVALASPGRSSSSGESEATEALERKTQDAQTVEDVDGMRAAPPMDEVQGHKGAAAVLGISVSKLLRRLAISGTAWQRCSITTTSTGS